MNTYFVSRHPGAIAWVKSQPLVVDHYLPHLDVALIRAGDTVIGSLPVNLAADVCAAGARYLHLALDLPEHLRGQELSLEQLRALNARLVAYVVQASPESD